jgi:hypothetical protein
LSLEGTGIREKPGVIDESKANVLGEGEIYVHVAGVSSQD